MEEDIGEDAEEDEQLSHFISFELLTNKSSVDLARIWLFFFGRLARINSS